jgi:hypothetical protein
MPVRDPDAVARTMSRAKFMLTMQGLSLWLLENKTLDLPMMNGIRAVHRFLMLFLTPKKSFLQSWAESFMPESPQWPEVS